MDMSGDKTMGQKIKKILHELFYLIYGRYPYNTVFSWNYLFTRKNIKWAKKYAEEFKSRTITDYGCGSLPYYPFFESYAVNYYALDFHFSNGVKGKEKVSCITLNDDGGIPLASVHELQKSDLILSFQVCNELENLEYYFSNIINITHTGTKILITTVFGQAALGSNDRLRVSPYSLNIILRKLGFKIIVYEPGGFFFTGTAVSLNLLLIAKNKYDYNSPNIRQSKIRYILFTPTVFIINIFSLILDALFPLKRSPCQYLIIAEKL
jgi:hypothetical protein